jgi:hypothetical protein
LTPTARQPESCITHSKFKRGLKVKPQTIRAGLCRDGHYQGLKPAKSRNRFLLWPADEADLLASGEVA